MTTEQLNIIITAQTTDFQEKLAAVNEALKETVSLAQQAASAAAALTGAQVSFGEAAAPDAAAVSDTAAQADTQTGIPAAPVHRGATDISEVRKASGYADFEEFAASVPELGKNQTLIGAFAAGGDNGKSGGQSAPIEIHTTVELDGERLGEAVASYNERMSRITDGFLGGA